MGVARQNKIQCTIGERIIHTVIFSLKKEIDPLDFLQKSKKLLSLISTVEKFMIFKQASKKNKFNFGFYMEFKNQKAYEEYSNHPDHIKYVKNIWLNEVEDFLETDFTEI
jgi:hypothetical protein